MSAATIVARQHVRMLSRSHTFALMLGVLLVMTALSGYIGWSSHSTITRIYEETVRTLRAAGKPVPPNPFATQPRLSLLNNMVIYLPLIGALLAIVIGHMSISEDRQAGVARIIFTRPVRRSSYFWGKLVGSTLAIASMMAACLVLSVVTVSFINAAVPTSSELLRLALFYGLSGLYLLLFTLVGALGALLTRSRSMGLFAAVAVWVLVTFATPQFTSGLRPVASLNPVTDPATISKSAFFRATSKLKPVAVNEQYKALSSRLLATGSSADPGKTVTQVLPIVALTLLLSGWTYLLIRRHDYSEEAPRD